MWLQSNFFNKHISLVLILVFLFSSCKSSKTIIGGEANLKLSARQLIKANSKQTPNFKTLQSKLKISYSDGENKQSHTVTYKMKKDSVLWMSATLGLIRAKITPKKVSFYNKLDKTYFDGDFSYLSKLLGTTIDFEKAQNIILGETLFNLKKESYKLSIQDNNYVLQPKKQRELFEIFFLVNPSIFKVKSQKLSQSLKKRHLQIDYLKYQKVDNEVLPELVKLIAVEANKEMIAELEFKSVSLNQDLRFPFKIPSGFKRIEL